MPTALSPAACDAEVVEVIVRLGETIVEVAHVAGRYQLGTAPDVDLAIETELGERFTLVDGFVAHVEGGEVPISRDTTLTTRLGALTLSLRRIPRPPRTLPHPIAVEPRALGYLGVSLLAHLALWNVATSRAPAHDEPRHRRVAIEARRAPPVRTREFGGPVPLPTTHLVDDDSDDIGEPGGGTPMALAAGLAGRPTATSERGHIAVTHQVATPQLTRAGEIARARTAGVLAAAALADVGALASTQALSSGFDATSISGALYGGTGESAGGFGLAAHAFDGASAGGSDYMGTIGIGHYHGIGNGQREGEGWGGRGLGAPSTPHVARVPTVMLCASPRVPCVIGSGGPDKAIIRRYLRRRLDAIAYCYEKELLAHPGLEGDVVTRFVIDPSGAVSVAQAEGVSPEVASCVAGVVRAIEFPRSVHGEPVQVTYPFTFRRTS